LLRLIIVYLLFLQEQIKGIIINAQRLPSRLLVADVTG